MAIVTKYYSFFWTIFRITSNFESQPKSIQMVPQQQAENTTIHVLQLVTSHITSSFSVEKLKPNFEVHYANYVPVDSQVFIFC
jgi:hypothetical protein